MALFKTTSHWIPIWVYYKLNVFHRLSFFVFLWPSNKPAGRYLLSDLRFGPQLQEAPGEAGCRLEVPQLEEEVEGGTQHQHHVNGLQIAVGEVGGHLWWGMVKQVSSCPVGITEYYGLHKPRSNPFLHI